MKHFKFSKKAQTFAKICIIWGLVFLLAFFVFLFLPVPFEITLFCAISFMISGFILLFYPLIFGRIPEDFDFKIKPDVFSVDYSCFDDFFDSTKKFLSSYELIEIYGKKYDDFEQHVYTQIYFDNKMLPHKDFIIIVNADETTEELISKADVDFIRSTEEFYRRRLKTIAWDLNVIFVFCASHLTPALEKLLRIDAGFMQTTSMSRFFSVVSFDTQKVYLIRRKGLLGKTKYDRCRKKFLNYFSFLFPKGTDK